MSNAECKVTAEDTESCTAKDIRSLQTETEWFSHVVHLSPYRAFHTTSPNLPRHRCFKYHLIVAQSRKPVQLSRTTSNTFTSYPAFDITLANLLRHRCFKISLLHRTMWKASLNSQEQPQLEPLPF